jgi:site-specific DNA recombinase
MTGAALRAAVGITRVSRVGDRDAEHFFSPQDQQQRMLAVAEPKGFQVVEWIEELDTSGGLPLRRRRGLRRALELIELGSAEVLLVAYFDRLVRNLTVQYEIFERVQKVGGSVFTCDVGEMRIDTPAAWLSTTVLGTFAEYYRRMSAERTSGPKKRAVERGVPPFPRIPPGYRRDEDGRLVVHPAEAQIVHEAFELRAACAPLLAIRDFLVDRGIPRTYRGTQDLLESKLVLGELHFGTLSNLESHPPIVERSLWEKAQRARASMGRRTKTPRLLARLGVLRCVCGSAMTCTLVANGQGKRFPFYRCGRPADCKVRVAMSAPLAEERVIARVREELEKDGSYGEASTDARLAAAQRQREAAEADLDAAIEAFSGLKDRPSARRRLDELQAALESAQQAEDRLRPAAAVARRYSVARDWARFSQSQDAVRALIRAVVRSATVHPGRGAGRRIEIEVFS